MLRIFGQGYKGIIESVFYDHREKGGNIET